MNTKEQPVLQNTITKGGNGDFEYDTAPEGISAYGLQGIKNVKISYEGHEKDGLQFIFRHRTQTNAFVNHKVTASIGKGKGRKSNLWITLENMLNVVIGEDITPEQAFSQMQSCIGKWFNIFVGHKASPDGQRIYCNVLENKIRPHPQSAEWGDCHKYFESGNSHNRELPPQQPSQPTGFESMPDAGSDIPLTEQYPYLIS